MDRRDIKTVGSYVYVCSFLHGPHRAHRSVPRVGFVPIAAVPAQFSPGKRTKADSLHLYDWQMCCPRYSYTPGRDFNTSCRGSGKNDKISLPFVPRKTGQTDKRIVNCGKGDNSRRDMIATDVCGSTFLRLRMANNFERIVNATNGFS